MRNNSKLIVVILLVLVYVLLRAQTSSIPTTNWVTNQGYITAVPSGLVTFIVSGTCPIGWTQVSSLNGVMLRGTLVANGDVGGNGGNATITPTGTISTPIFTGSQSTTSATSAGTSTGTNGTSSVTTTSGSKAGSSAGAYTAIGGSAVGSSFSVPAQIFTGSAMATHTHTITPTGTISIPTFTGVAIDPSPMYKKVIFCSAN
jgi:hypothetical protein